MQTRVLVPSGVLGVGFDSDALARGVAKVRAPALGALFESVARDAAVRASRGVGVDRVRVTQRVLVVDDDGGHRARRSGAAACEARAGRRERDAANARVASNATRRG